MKQPTSIIVQLVHIHGPLKGEIQEFGSNEIIIGRHASCDLQFPQDLIVISRKHANIIREGNRFKIIDHSTNGTFVNGERITEAYLKNGDVIFFTEGGPKVSFLTRVGEVLEIPDAVPVPAPAPPQPAPQSIQQPVPQPAVPPTPQPIPQPVPQPIQHSIPQPVPQPILQPESQIPIQIETVKAPLVIQYGPVLQSFNELPITIGTHGDADLVLSHPALHERHVQIFFAQGSYRIKDLTGLNQILINNQPIVSPAALIPGDTLFLSPDGPAFHFMEGGRMLEMNIPKKETPDDIENPIPEKKEEPVKKKTGSLFKKLFG